MMTFTRKIFAMMLMLVVSTTAFAEVKTWSHVWDTSKSNGGEGFYHIITYLITQILCKPPC